jgi:hypothetical protein
MTVDQITNAVHTELKKHGWPDWALTDGEVRYAILESLLAAQGPVVLDADQQRMAIAVTVRQLNQRLTPPTRNPAPATTT